jgi:mannosyltransferase OCH1-like enzyme
MIPKIIHQVFWAFNDKELNEIEAFKNSVEKTKQFCDKYNYEYRMWNLKDCEELICDKYPEYICIWNEFRFPIQRVDFIRYVILYECGGFYVDCDVYPIQDLESLLNLSQVFTSWNNDAKKLPYNAVMGSEKGNPLFTRICYDVILRVPEKQNKKIYDTWKGRLVFQTTGHHMLKRHVPKDSIYDLLMVYNEKKKLNITSPNPYFYDNNISSWVNF